LGERAPRLSETRSGARARGGGLGRATALAGWAARVAAVGVCVGARGGPGMGGVALGRGALGREKAG
jgi:hypothetical protein